jgi:tetratricopeptide (TPR) repeat protein
MGKKQDRRGKHFYLFFACSIIISVLLTGCAHFYEELITRSDFQQAGDFTRNGNYKASVSKYEQIIAGYPLVGDRVLFQMGIIYASPRNQQKDYQKSLDYFQRLIKNYPESGYRQDSDTLIFLIHEISSRDKSVFTQRRQIDKLEQQIDKFEQQVDKLKQQVEESEKKIERIKEVDMNLKHKKKTLP